MGKKKMKQFPKVFEQYKFFIYFEFRLKPNKCGRKNNNNNVNCHIYKTKTVFLFFFLVKLKSQKKKYFNDKKMNSHLLPPYIRFIETIN